MVLHGNRLEDLRELLTQFLQHQALGPLQEEVILVQSNGMKHWLEMALADDAALGICAATRMELPSSYLWQVYRRVLGAEAVPHHMPFDKASLLWRLVRLLPDLTRSNPVYAGLERYLQGDAAAAPGGRRLYQLAQQIADVLDAYQSYRADWLADWAEGRDVLRRPQGPDLPLAPTQRWQAQLWRDIRADIGALQADASRSSVHARFCSRMQALAREAERSGRRPDALPARVVVFGISSLPMQTVEALAWLGRVSQVLMLVQNPCQHYWGDLVEGHALLRPAERRRQQPKAALQGQPPAGHPLLASWGKQGRDYLHLLDDYDRVEDYQARLQRVDAFVDPAGLQERPHQLAQLQSAILRLDEPPAAPVPLAEDDDSITLVSAHSPQREVEVLHDRLWAWFEADAQLQPRDVMVMVPDMEVFAPHIHAVFGRFARGHARHIPYSVADTTERTSPMVQALEQLLSLPTARISLVDWLALLEVAAVRTRFGLQAADVDRLRDWLLQAGVRWGLDARHRKAWGVADVAGDQNTWAFGLRRLLLGYAVGGGGEVWQETLPQPALASLDAALMGSLLDWLDAADQTLAELGRTQSPSQWGASLAALVARFFKASDEAEERQVQRMLDALEAWQQVCAQAQLDSPLALEVVREHWLSQLGQGGLHQRFFGGGVQFGTLMPMRSIPFRVIALLGMNDGDYPRQSAARDFDLMAEHWRVGDRSRREDDRYLFLEALLSARDRLYLSWQGHKATDNTPLPPSVLVAQLQDYLARGWTPCRSVQVQPLQPYSEAYFVHGSPLQTYAREWAQVHAARASATGGAAEPEAAAPRDALTHCTLDELRRLLRAPVELYFRSRLQVHLAQPDEEVPEQEPFAIDRLEHHRISQLLFGAPDPHAELARLRHSGRLPLAGFAERELDQLERELDTVLHKLALWRAQFPHPCEPWPLNWGAQGLALTGSLGGLRARWPVEDGAADPASVPAGQALLQCVPHLAAVLEGGQTQPRARGHIVARLWADHLAACALGLPLQSVVLGLDGQVVLPPLPAAEAQAQLVALLQVAQEAWRRPLPLAAKTAWAFLMGLQPSARASATRTPEEAAHSEARKAFEGGFQFRGEWQDSAYLQRAFDGYDDLAPHLGHWAEALYGPLARACQVQRFGAGSAGEGEA